VRATERPGVSQTAPGKLSNKLSAGAGNDQKARLSRSLSVPRAFRQLAMDGTAKAVFLAALPYARFSVVVPENGTVFIQVRLDPLHV
jgi:hypothetical protein